MEPIPVFKEKKGISPVWTLPIIALGICLWIVYTSYKNAGIPITVYFEDATGITAGKTQVIARGVPIGMVTRISPDLGNRRVKTIVKMDKSAADLLVEDTLFWIVRPEISAASVQGLDTLLSGSYIAIQPGTSEIKTRIFTGVDSAPPIPGETPGLHIQLRAQELGSIQNGSEVYYRNVSIGFVTKHRLDPASDSIIISLFIRPEYVHLVKEGSRFCNASGFEISGKLTNLKIHVESLAALIRGGIVLHTPVQLSDTRPVGNGHTFPLYKNLEAARYGIPMTLQLASSVDIAEGETQIIYRGLVAGVVEKIEFSNSARQSVIAHVMLDPRAERILRQGTKFWIVKPEISTEKMENLDLLLTGPYITFMPGSGPFQDSFDILPEPPPQQPLRPGSTYLLTATDSHALQRGAPVMYKNKRVGEIIDVELSENSDNFEIQIFIYKQYEKLVKPESVFWKDGGVSFDASLKGVHLQSNSLSSILKGGISFMTPVTATTVKDAEIKEINFPLYSSFDEAQSRAPQLKKQGYRFQLITENPDFYDQGTPIYYKKIQVGRVVGLRLSKDNRFVLLDCFIRQDYGDTVNSSSRFYDASGISFQGNLSGVSVETGSLESMLIGGLSYYTPTPSAPQDKKATFPLYADKAAAQAIDKITIVVKFSDCSDLRTGSPVKYKGVQIGEVTNLRFAENLSDVLVTLLVERKAADFFREDTLIWLEKAQVGLGGIKNLKNILFGASINIFPGEGAMKRTFIARLAPPSTPADIAGGLQLVLESKHLGSLKINSPVYYRQIKVGRVVDFQLSKSYDNVHVFINIDKPYMPLIRENTRFWKASGAKISGGLFSGLSISTESLEALLTGGIALATPGNSEMGRRVASNHHFPLYEKPEESWLDWQPSFTLVGEEKQRQARQLEQSTGTK